MRAMDEKPTGLSPWSPRRIEGGSSAAPACRLAKITQVVTRSSGDPVPDTDVLEVYRIRFVDGTFTNLATVQTATLTERDSSGIYFASARWGSALGVGSLVFVTWHNGGWWIVQGAAGRISAATALETRINSGDETAQFQDPDGLEVTGWWLGGGVVKGWVYYLQSFGDDWLVLNPTLGLTVRAITDGVVGGDASFQFLDEDVEQLSIVVAHVLLGPVTTGNNYVLQWTQLNAAGGYWVALGDVGGAGGFSAALIGTCVAAFSSGQGAFSTGIGTVSASLGRGMCLAGRDYILQYANSAWVVADPELTVLVKTSAVITAGNSATVTVYSGTSGSETSTGASLSVYLRKGLLFDNARYEATWIESGWKIANPSTEFVGTAAAAIAVDTSVTQLIATGSLGSESSSGVSVTVRNSWGEIANGMRVRCAWCDWPTGGGWEYVNARCG